MDQYIIGSSVHHLPEKLTRSYSLSRQDTVIDGMEFRLLDISTKMYFFVSAHTEMPVTNHQIW